MAGCRIIGSSSKYLHSVEFKKTGIHIVEFEQNGEDRAAYGEQLLKKLESRFNILCQIRIFGSQ